MQHPCELACGGSSPGAGGASPAQHQHHQQLLVRRKAASEFVQAATGVFVPYASDAAFRAGLKDGVLLCRVANTVWGGACAIKVRDSVSHARAAMRAAGSSSRANSNSNCCAGSAAAGPACACIVAAGQLRRTSRAARAARACVLTRCRCTGRAAPPAVPGGV